MAKINIHVELDTQTDDLSTLIAIAEAFGGKVAIEPKAPVEEKETPKVAAKKTKKAAKAETPKEDTWAPGGGLVDDEPDDAPEENYTVDDVRTTMAEAKRSGKESADLRAILKANGAAIVSDLDPKKFAAVIKAVKAL